MPQAATLSTTASRGTATSGEPAAAREFGYIGRHRGPGRDGRIIVLIPAHHEDGTVGRCIEALAAQSRVPDEMIVVADNCTDQGDK